MKTKVKFLVNEREGDLFAFFSEAPYEDINIDNLYKEQTLFESYSHIGQHSACHIEYANESREATKEEYAPLMEELISMGYDIEVLNT